MSAYSVKILNASKELSLKEKVVVKNITDPIILGTAAEVEPVKIDLDYWVELDVHNEKAEQVDYTNYILYDKNGTVYQTSSQSFWQTFTGIYEEVSQEPDTDWLLVVYAMPSKNRQGKTYLTCSIE